MKTQRHTFDYDVIIRHLIVVAMVTSPMAMRPGVDDSYQSEVISYAQKAAKEGEKCLSFPYDSPIIKMSGKYFYSTTKHLHVTVPCITLTTGRKLIRKLSLKMKSVFSFASFGIVHDVASQFRQAHETTNKRLAPSD